MPAFTPIYRRIITDIRARIESGELPPGAVLPSTREMAAQYDCAQTTVRQAITILLEAGVLVGHQGKAVRVADPAT